MALDVVERNRQYPLNEGDGFMLSGATYFDTEALAWYRSQSQDPIFRGQFVVSGRRTAEFMKLRDGVIAVYERPKPDGKYAIGVDVSSGKSADYTVGTVIDLSSGAIVAVLRAKMEAPRAAVQVHFLGKWFNNAKVCIERQGGWGEALIVALRDGNENIPVYGNLYRHVKYDKSGRPLSDDFGHPMGPSNRNSVLENLKGLVRERLFPFMPEDHMFEMGTFVYKGAGEGGPSPAAQEGTNDDCVMSLALAAEMYRQFGQAPAKRRRHRKAKYRPPPTRQVA